METRGGPTVETEWRRSGLTHGTLRPFYTRWRDALEAAPDRLEAS